VGADDDRRSGAREDADDVAQSAPDRLEAAVRQQLDEAVAEPAELRRPGRALADLDLLVDQLERGGGVEAVG